MSNLCYSTFLKLVQRYYSYDIEAEVLARSVLSSITPVEYHKKFTKANLSLFWTRERNITNDILSFSKDSLAKASCLDYFTNYIVADINPLTEDDFYYNLENLISNDDSISPRKKTSLHNILLSGNKAKYLTAVFLYALQKDNKIAKSTIEPDDIALLSEVDQVCPICCKQLIEVKKNKKIYRFASTRIYPEYLDPSLKNEFDLIKPKPIDPDDKINKVCLCDVCSTDYLFNPTLDIYDRLIRIKEHYLSKPSLSPIANRVIDEQIIDVLNKLKKTSPTNPILTASRMKPLELANKIPSDNFLLLKAIKDDNDAYFYYIKDHLSIMEEYSSTFEIIASDIHSSFLVLNKKGLDHDEIYNQLINWILTKLLLPQNYYNAVHIIISFFVQNCEVFNEITE